MNTWHYLTDPSLRGMYWPAVLTGIAVAAMCSMLSVLVVLRRLAFIGQGVSHAAFGGVGIVAMLGLAGAATYARTLEGYAIIFVFCLLAAVIIGWLSQRGGTRADTAIGIVLVASMALGAVLVHLSHSGVSWESFLFGSIMGVGLPDVAVGAVVAVIVLGTLWATRRQLLFWAFDPGVALAMGVRDRAMNLMLMTLLALATITTMKLAGVVLATALLVMPGAVALRLSRRSAPVLMLAALVAGLGVLVGLVVSFELDWPPGPSIVGVLTLLFAAASFASPRH